MGDEQVVDNKEATGGDKPVGDKPAGDRTSGDGGSGGADAAARLTALEAENTRLREATERATRDAEGSKAYVQNLIAQIQEAASRAEAVDPNDPNLKESIRERLNEDPVGFLNQHFQERIRPLASFALDNQATLNRQLAAERLKTEDWGEYEKEVDEFMAGMPPEVRAKPGSYEAAFRFVLAKPENFEKLVQKRVERELNKGKEAFVERPTSGVRGAPAKPPLTDMQKAIAKGLGISEEEYVTFME